jgi:cytochrome b561
MSICYGYSVGWFGIVLPSILIKNEQLGEYFSEIHEISANILIGLIVLHIIGFIKHLVVDKKNLLKRMI